MECGSLHVCVLDSDTVQHGSRACKSHTSLNAMLMSLLHLFSADIREGAMMCALIRNYGAICALIRIYCACALIYSIVSEWVLIA